MPTSRTYEPEARCVPLLVSLPFAPRGRSIPIVHSSLERERHYHDAARLIS